MINSSLYNILLSGHMFGHMSHTNRSDTRMCSNCDISPQWQFCSSGLRSQTCVCVCVWRNTKPRLCPQSAQLVFSIFEITIRHRCTLSPPCLHLLTLWGHTQSHTRSFTVVTWHNPSTVTSLCLYLSVSQDLYLYIFFVILCTNLHFLLILHPPPPPPLRPPPFLLLPPSLLQLACSSARTQQTTGQLLSFSQSY